MNEGLLLEWVDMIDVLFPELLIIIFVAIITLTMYFNDEDADSCDIGDSVGIGVVVAMLGTMLGTLIIYALPLIIIALLIIFIPYGMVCGFKKLKELR